MTDPQYNTRDLVKWICLLALRTAAVEQRTWQDLLAYIRERGVLGIIWTHPDKPVFCGHDNNAASVLDVDRGLSISSFSKMQC